MTIMIGLERNETKHNILGDKMVQAWGTVHMAAVVAGLSLGQHG